MNIFDTIPDKFFSVLSGGLKAEFSSILFKIYITYKRSGLGLDRGVVLDIVEEELSLVSSDVLDSELIKGTSFYDESNSRWRVYNMLSKLEKCGWLRTETLTNHSQIITIPDYAYKLLEVLEIIYKGETEEYQGYVFATYSSLCSDEVLQNGSIALDTAHKQTRSLIIGLRNLRDNIKSHIEKVLEGKDPKDVLKLHFEDYKKDILDRSYHRLKTSDNVSRYRPRIMKKVNDLSDNDKWIHETTIQELAAEKHATYRDTERSIRSRLSEISQVYSQLDDVLEEIDNRNLQYARSSYNRLEMMLQSRSDVSGQITEILKYLARLRREDVFQRHAMLSTQLESLFSVFEQNYISKSSLYTPRNINRQHDPQELLIINSLSSEDKLKNLNAFKQKVKSRMTRDKINYYVQQLLNGRDQAYACELPLSSIEDFVKLIFIVAYANSSKSVYKIERSSGENSYAGDYITSDIGFSFKNFKIMNKGRVK